MYSLPCALPGREAGGFTGVRLTDLGSGHAICCERKSSLPGEGAHLDPADKMAFKYLHFIYLGRRILATSCEARYSLPSTSWDALLPWHRRRDYLFF